MTSPARLPFRLSLEYAAVFLALGLYMPFFPVWLQAKGMSADEIGLLMALPLLVRVFGVPPVAQAADRLGRLRDMYILCLILAIAAMAGMSFLEGFWPLLIGLAVAALCWNPAIPLLDAYVLNAVRIFKLDFGRIRTWGSIAFVGGNLLGGWAAGWVEPVHLIWLFVLIFIPPLLLAPVLPARLGDGPVEAAKPKAWRGLLRDRPLLLIFLASGLLQGSHAIYYSLASPHWAAEGLSSQTIGAIWAIGVAAEVALFHFGRPLLARTGPFPFILAGGAIGGARWALLSFDPGAGVLLPASILHGGSFSAVYLGTMALIAARTPLALSATAQGLNASIVGLAMAAATLGGGLLWKAAGPQAYWAMSAMSAAGLICALAAWIRPGRSNLESAESSA